MLLHAVVCHSMFEQWRSKFITARLNYSIALNMLGSHGWKAMIIRMLMKMTSHRISLDKTLSLADIKDRQWIKDYYWLIHLFSYRFSTFIRERQVLNTLGMTSVLSWSFRDIVFHLQRRKSDSHGAREYLELDVLCGRRNCGFHITATLQSYEVPLITRTLYFIDSGSVQSNLASWDVPVYISISQLVLGFMASVNRQMYGPYINDITSQANVTDTKKEQRKQRRFYTAQMWYFLIFFISLATVSMELWSWHRSAVIDAWFDSSGTARLIVLPWQRDRNMGLLRILLINCCCRLYLVFCHDDLLVFVLVVMMMVVVAVSMAKVEASVCRFW